MSNPPRRFPSCASSCTRRSRRYGADSSSAGTGSHSCHFEIERSCCRHGRTACPVVVAVSVIAPRLISGGCSLWTHLAGVDLPRGEGIELHLHLDFLVCSVGGLGEGLLS